MNEFNFAKSVMDDIYQQALAEYPGECCGWVIQNNDGSQVYSAAENMQDKYHKLDPEAYPRTSKDAFLMNTMKLTRAVEEAEAKGGQLFSIVHSHIDCDAYFSDEDKFQMSDQETKDQIYPANNYLVVSIQDNKHHSNAVFSFDAESKSFIEGKVNITNNN